MSQQLSWSREGETLKLSGELDQDLLKTASEVPDDLLKLRVLMTAIDGCPVYRAKN